MGEQGRVKGKAEGVVTVLEARGLTVSAAHRERILACQDATVLERWLRRTVTPAAVEDVLAD